MEIFFSILLVVVGISTGFLISYYIINTKFNNSAKKAEELIEKTKKALEGEDLEEIKKAKDNLLTKANELATKVYEEAAKNNQTETTSNEEKSKNKESKDDVVDAEYEEK